MGPGAAIASGVRLALVAGGIVVAVVLALRIGVLLLEPRATFFPVREYFETPGGLGLPFEDVVFRAADGVRLHGWFIPGQARGGAAAPAPTLLLFHGNAENIGGCVDLAGLTRPAGWNLFLVDYRGYGESEGRPGEAGLYRDGSAALARLLERGDVDRRRIVVWGRSIGAAVAVYLAAGGENQRAVGSQDRPPVAGVILESPFTSAPDLLRAGGHWTLYALSRFGTYRFDSASRMPRVGAPVLILHGTADDIAPFVLGRRLFDLAPGTKDLVAIQGGGHNDLWVLHAGEMWGAIRNFLDSIDRGDARAPGTEASGTR